MRRDALPLQAAEPAQGRTKIQVAYPPSLLTVDPLGLLPTDIRKGTKPPVEQCFQVGIPGISANLLAENTDLWEGEIGCYTQSGHRWPPLDGD